MKGKIITVGELKKILNKYDDDLKVGIDTYGLCRCAATPIAAVYKGFDLEVGWLMIRTKPPMKRVMNKTTLHHSESRP